MLGLAKLMEKQGETMAQLAKWIGVDENTVWRWKSGRNVPSLDIYAPPLCEV